jgi:hypothetical protein
MADIDCNRPSRTSAPPPRLSPFEGPSCRLATLVLGGGLAGAMGGVAFLHLLTSLREGIEVVLFIGAVGLVGGATFGMFGGVVIGQVARVVFQRQERRYYQLVGALLTGALSGVAWVYGFLWGIFSALNHWK